MKMYKGEVDWIIADNPEEAYKICLETYTMNEEDYPENDFVEEPMDKTLTIDMIDWGRGKVTKTVAEFIKEFGKGFFASTEY